MALRFRRGTTTERDTVAFAVGEPIWDTTDNSLHVGDGTTDGGIAVGASLTFTDTTNDSDTLGVDFTNNNGVITGTVDASSVKGDPGEAGGGGAGFTLGTEVATDSGTVASFTGIPTGTTQIVINFIEVVRTGSAELALNIEIGDAGGPEQSDYSSVGGLLDGNAIDIDISTASFPIRAFQTNHIISGTMTLTLEDDTDNTWTSTHICYVRRPSGGNPNTLTWGAGSKSLSAELDRVLVNADGAFSGGAINISYI